MLHETNARHVGGIYQESLHRCPVAEARGCKKAGGNAVKEDNRPKSRSLRVTKSRKFQSREGLKCRLMYSPSFKFPLTKRAIDIYPYM